MADKAITELVAAEQITATDLFVLQQNNTAKKLPAQVLLNWLTAAADGHGGIQSIVKLSTSGLVDTYRITLADTTIFDFVVTNGRAISSITQTEVNGLTRTYTIAFNDGSSETFSVADGRGIQSFLKTSTEGLVDTYTVTYNDGTRDAFTVKNGEKGDKGDNAYIWVKYASQEPTAGSHSFGDVADNWIGVYSGASATAPTDWQQYEWFKIKGEQGDTGNPATLNSSAVEYQVSDSGTIVPSGAWSASVPVVAQGKYLWTRITHTFNTGSPVVSYSVARMGLDGSGSVSSVADISPDEYGNVPLTAADLHALPNTGGDLTGELRMNGQPIRGLNAPTANDQAANMGFVNQQVKKAAQRSLLGNSNFTNPVNQRGSGDTTNAFGYPVDRWQYSYDGDIPIGSSGYDASRKYVYLVNNASGGGNVMLFQKIPAENLRAGKYTVAFHQVGANLAFSMLAYANGEIVKSETVTPTDGVSLMSFELAQVQTELTIYIYAAPGQTIVMDWAALYEGEYTVDTLPEYHPNGYGAELAECQRYLQRFRTTDLRKTYCEDFRPTMRMTEQGVVSTFEQAVDGVTYYFASAEL